MQPTHSSSTKNLKENKYCNINLDSYLSQNPFLVNNAVNIKTQNNYKFKLIYLLPTIFIDENFIPNLIKKKRQLPNGMSYNDLVESFCYYRLRVYGFSKQKFVYMGMVALSLILYPLYSDILVCLF